jgi:hypothetical protein
MDEEKKWMLMTYYCPTHGDSGMIKPIEITKKEINKTFQKKDITSKNEFISSIYEEIVTILI